MTEHNTEHNTRPKTTMHQLAKADWEKLEQEVVERIRALAIIAKNLEPGPWSDKIADGVILPNLGLLAHFCENVKIDEDDHVEVDA